METAIITNSINKIGFLAFCDNKCDKNIVVCSQSNILQYKNNKFTGLNISGKKVHQIIYF